MRAAYGAYMKDDKKFYNVSVPLYTNLFLNTFFTNSNNALNILNSLRYMQRMRRLNRWKCITGHMIL